LLLLNVFLYRHKVGRRIGATNRRCAPKPQISSILYQPSAIGNAASIHHNAALMLSHSFGLLSVNLTAKESS
ncbi:MAG: hypothetical protein ACNA71_07000, partial [Kiritimatiellia bacterium]